MDFRSIISESLNPIFMEKLTEGLTLHNIDMAIKFPKWNLVPAERYVYVKQ